MRDQPRAYLETRPSPKTDSALAATIIQHWHTRHLYGKALSITSDPPQLAKLTRKRWLSVMQTLQNERTATTDADHLLTLTHAITRMQQMVITTDPPSEYPAAHFWVITPEQLLKTELPRACRTVYIATPLASEAKQQLYDILPSHSLVVNYTSDIWQDLRPKAELEDKVHHAWQELSTFLNRHSIHPEKLIQQQHTIDDIDDALDTLLDNGSAFLRHARQFQEALHLAQPLQLSHNLKQQYELASLLARRVAMLTPGVLHHSFIQADNDTFSLYDVTSPQKYTRESLSAAVARHIKAGRKNLAQALENAFVNNLLIH